VSAQTPFEQGEVKRLIALMRDPRYWRDQDPEMQRMVREGLRRLYGLPPRRQPPAHRPRPQSAA
jgi:hypothetical protein